MAERVLITIGTNIAREINLSRALHSLTSHPCLRVVAVSPVYETPAVGGTQPQPAFYNAAVLVETDLTPAELRNVLRLIETGLGRVRSADKFAPRPIDLDIAFFGDRVFDLAGRHIPDPDVLRYPHLAVPLADIAPDWRHPETGQTLAEIVAHQRVAYGEFPLRRVELTI
jgi:2-amino-4-hydroxy-6-hydroxymethyldihydropteridine diphosphokinase